MKKNKIEEAKMHLMKAKELAAEEGMSLEDLMEGEESEKEEMPIPMESEDEEMSDDDKEKKKALLIIALKKKRGME